MTTADEAPRTLLTLPGEIRNAIYEFAMISPNRRLRLDWLERDELDDSILPDAPPRYRFREEHAFSTFALALALLL